MRHHDLLGYHNQHRSLYLIMPAYSRYGRRRTTSKRSGLYKRKKWGSRNPVSRRKPTRAVQRYSRAIASSGFAGIPMQIGNYTTRQKLYTVTFRDTISVYPATNYVQGSATNPGIDGDTGAISFSICASTPNHMWSAAQDGAALGQIAHANASNTTGENQMCEHAFANYDRFMVKKAVLEIIASPSVATQDDFKWVSESAVFMTLSKQKQPWSHGTTIAGLDDVQQVQMGRNVIQGMTQKTAGAAAKQCYLKGVYTPRRLFSVDDLRDRSAFWGITMNDYSVETAPPTNSAFWNVLIVPKSPQFTASQGGTPKPGVPLPHRVDIKITYIVEAFRNETEDNAPL